MTVPLFLPERVLTSAALNAFVEAFNDLDSEAVRSTGGHLYLTAVSPRANTLQLTKWGGAITHYFSHMNNGQLVLRNSTAGVNTLALENDNPNGYGAMTASGLDTYFPSTGQNPNGCYEHMAVGYGATLSLNGVAGVAYVEVSRFPDAQVVDFPPTTFAIQQTGGVMRTPTQDLIFCTTGQFTITRFGGGTFPANCNGWYLRELGDCYHFPPGTRIVSGQGTATVTLNKAALQTNGNLPVLYGAQTAGQYSAAIFRDLTSIDWYTWANGVAHTAPYMKFDRINGRLALGALTSETVPVAPLDVLGSAYFGAEPSGSANRATTYANAPLNVIDAGTKGLHWLKVGVNTFKMDWAASPNAVQFTDGNATLPVLSLYMDGTGTVKTGGGIIRKTRVVTEAGAVTVANTDDVIVVKKTVGAATTVNLPASPEAGRTFTIKDGKGDAATNNIVIDPAGGTLIDGTTTLTLSTNYARCVVVFDGTAWMNVT